MYGQLVHVWHDFCICDLKNAIICSKIRNMLVFAKYVIARH